MDSLRFGEPYNKYYSNIYDSLLIANAFARIACILSLSVVIFYFLSLWYLTIL